jgi:hypothetical protein
MHTDDVTAWMLKDFCRAGVEPATQRTVTINCTWSNGAQLVSGSVLRRDLAVGFKSQPRRHNELPLMNVFRSKKRPHSIPARPFCPLELFTFEQINMENTDTSTWESVCGGHSCSVRNGGSPHA